MLPRFYPLTKRASIVQSIRRGITELSVSYRSPHRKQSAVVAPEVKQAVDFFGRAIVAKALTASQEAGKLHFLFFSLRGLDSDLSCCLVAALLAPPPPKKIKQTMYKFNEGFSNAVRTTKRVSDFFA